MVRLPMPEPAAILKHMRKLGFGARMTFDNLYSGKREFFRLSDGVTIGIMGADEAWAFAQSHGKVA